jgi:hypothetical protein
MDIVTSILCSIAAITPDDHRMDGLFLVRIFVGFFTDLLDVFIASKSLNFHPPAVLYLYLFILTLLPMFAFHNILLRFYGHKSAFLLFKLVSTCNVIFLYSVVYFESKTCKWKTVFNVYFVINIFLNVLESISCIFQ